MDKDAILKILSNLERQLREQQQQINNLKNQLVHKQHEAKPEKETLDHQVVKESARPLEPKRGPFAPQPEGKQREISRGPARQPSQGPESYPQKKPVAQKKQTLGDIELWVGNYGLQILGVIIFLFGAGFGLKYSIEKGWITPIMRFASAIVTGLGFIGLAEYIHQKKKKWADACLGGGVALLFGAIYYGYEYYNLFSINYAVVGSLLAGALGLSLAIRYNSQVVATLSVLGSYVLPMFITHQTFDPSFTAGYYLLLSACSVFLACRYDWVGLFVTTCASLVFVDLSTMFNLFGEKTSYSLHFIVGIFAIFTLIPLLFCVLKKCNWFASFSIFFAGIYSFPRILVNLEHMFKGVYTIQQLATLILVGFGLFYGLLYLVLQAYKKDEALYKEVGGTLLMLSIASFAGAIWAHFDNHMRIVVLAVYAVLLYIVGACYSPSRVMRFMSKGVWAFPVLHYLESLNHATRVTYFTQNTKFDFLFNSMTLSAFVLAGTFFLASYVTNKCKQKLSEVEHGWEQIFEVLGLLSIMSLMFSNVWHFKYVSVGFSVFAASVFIIGRYLGRSVWRYVSAFAVFINIGFVAFYYSQLVCGSGSWIAHLTFGAFAISATLCELFRRYRLEHTSNDDPLVPDIIQSLVGLGWFMWGRVAIVSYFEQFSGESQLHTIKNSILVAYYILWAGITYVVGLLNKKRLWLFVGALSMLANVAYIAFNYNKFVYHNLPMMTHLIFGSLTIVSLLCALITNRYKEKLDKDDQAFVPIGQGLVAFVGFIWGHVAIVSYFGRLSGYDELYTLKEALLTIYYALSALTCMTVGLLKRNSVVRYFGFALIGLTLINLWKIIWSFQDTLYRIVAFLVVGLLIILLSFVYQYLSKRIAAEE